MNTFSRVMAVDFGERRSGIAVSDPLGIMAQPLTTLEISPKKLAPALLDLIRQHSVVDLVIGIPYEMDGSIGPQAEKVLCFCEELKKLLALDSKLANLPLHHIDERLTSRQADRFLAGSKLKNKDRSSAIDQISACILVETFLANRTACHSHQTAEVIL